MSHFKLQKSREVFFFFRPPPHRQKIYNLNEQSRMPSARLPHDLNQLTQARNETVMSDAQQRPARNVAHARGLDHDRAGTPLGEAPVPVEDILRDKAFFGRPPRNHRRNPRPAFKRYAPDANRGKQQRRGGFFRRRPARVGKLVTYRIFRMPHKTTSSRLISTPRSGVLNLAVGFNPRDGGRKFSASRQRRLNSIVADATWKTNHGRRGLKPTAKLRRRYAAGSCEPVSLAKIYVMTRTAVARRHTRPQTQGRASSTSRE